MRRPTEDTLRHQGLRNKLIAQLEAKGIKDPQVLTAMGKVPRHFFLDIGFDELAYSDRSFPIFIFKNLESKNAIIHILDIFG
jgi:protein-L-isoaspartate(D-aspartate) O-methyltransferase